jgi:hypothetical protein
MEIKVGDKVRVSKDAPEMYFFGCNYGNSVCKVILVDRDNAVITQVKNGSFAIPTKYLTKVNVGAKEPKFKAGEIVRYRYDGKLYIVECKTGKYYYTLRQVGGDIMMHDALESDLELVTEPKQEIKVGDMIDTPKGKGKVTMVADGYVLAQGDNGEWWQMITIPIDKDKEFEDNIRKVLNGTDEFPMGGHIPTSIIQIGETDWDAYAADLAKDIALKVANKYSGPAEAADYAVSVAKAVVENLKRK